MKTMHPISRFLLILALSFGILFLMHFYLLHIFDFDVLGNRIVSAYLVNFVLVAAIYTALYALRNKIKDQIGFLFMGGSLVKFLVFFAVFYPSYRSDGVMDKLEFAAFFVPYALGLILETIFTVKMLKLYK